MKLTLPEGFTAPQNARPEEPFEVVATICPCEDGTFSLVAIDGVKLPEDDEENEMEEEETATERTDASNIRLPFGEEEDD